jgi:hypothetical protein
VSDEPITDDYRFRVLAKMTDDLLDDVTSRDDTIARLTAEGDQLKAEYADLYDRHEAAWREVERLRRVCRAAGVEHRTGGA